MSLPSPAPSESNPAGDAPTPEWPTGAARLGNDVVDLRHPRCRSRPEGDRLPLRILTLDEMEWFAEPSDPRSRLRRLWALWAAKETAFKVVSKVAGRPPVFRHQAFAAQLDESMDGSGITSYAGQVEWAGLRCRVEGMATEQFLHLVGWNEPPGQTRPPRVELGVEGFGATDLQELPNDEERRRGVRGPLSLRARRVASARLASYLDRDRSGTTTKPSFQRIRIITSSERPGRAPPRVWVDGEPRPDLDLTISHHGRYVGWAFLLPSPGPEAVKD